MLRSVFTLREFARLASTLPDELGRDGAGAAERWRAVSESLADRRGALRPESRHDDDVVDPYGRGERTWWEFEDTAVRSLLGIVERIAV